MLSLVTWSANKRPFKSSLFWRTCDAPRLVTTPVRLERRVQFTSVHWPSPDEQCDAPEDLEKMSDTVPGELQVLGSHRQDFSLSRFIAKSATSVPWTPSGTIKKNPGCGDCVYHALAQSLNAFGDTSRDGGARSHRHIRAFACACVTKHFKRFEELCANATFSQYLDRQKAPGCWGGALEILAFAEAHGVQIWIGNDQGQVWTFNEKGRDQSVYLWYADPLEWAIKLKEQREAGAPGPALLLRGGAPDTCSLRLSDFASKKAVTTLSDFGSVPPPPSHLTAHSR